MNHARLTVLTIAVLVAATVTVADDTAPQQGIRDNTPKVHAFTGATIVVAPGNVMRDATLVTRDGRIEAVGTGFAPPPDAVVHDSSGLTIYPGFIDPYTQYGVKAAEVERRRGRAAPVYEGTRVGGNAWNDAIHAEVDWGETFTPDEDAAKKLIELGYTVVQSAKMDGIFRGRGFVASLRDTTPNEALVAPTSRHFLAFDKGSSKQAYPSSLMGAIALVRQTFLDASWYTGAAAPELNRALEALATYDGPFIVETGNELSLLRASRIAAEMKRPMVYLGSHREANRIDDIAALQSPVVLPVSLPRKPDMIRAGDEIEVTLGQLRLWERAPETAALLESRKVPVAFTAWELGSEESFFKNIRSMISSGLTADGALAALTIVPARIAGVEREVGTLERGKRANFVITRGDLFSEGTIDAVWIDGHLAHRPAPDFRGTYATALEGKAVSFEVEGTSSSKAKAKISTDDGATDKADIVFAGDAGTFYADLTPIGVEGRGWFRIERIDSVIRLVYTAPSGLTTATALDRSPEAKNEEAKEPEASISRLTLPNIAFGWESLPKAESVLVHNATIWTSDDAGVLEGADLLVANGKIAKIGTNLTAPAGTRVIDGSGMHVTPGIIDEHSHLAISGGVNEGTHAATAEVRIGDVLNPDEIGIYRALAGGVTVAQLLHGSANPIGGQAQIIRMKWGSGSEDLKFPGAPPSIKFALGENVKQSNWGDDFTTRYPQTRMGVDTFMRDRFTAAREYGDEWKAWNALKKNEKAKSPAPRRDLQLETLLEILESKRFIHCHSYVQSEILSLMRLADDFGFRIQTFTHILEGYKVASEMAKHGAGASAFADWWAYKFEVYDAIPQANCITNERGVLTSVNSDSANTIRRLNQDAGKSVMYCGMDEVDALKMVTINPAMQLKIDGRVGSLREGKDADFVIWNGHPLSLYSHPEQTWIEGTNYFDRERDREMRARDAEEKAALVTKALSSNDKRGGPPPGKAEEQLWHCGDTEVSNAH